MVAGWGLSLIVCMAQMVLGGNRCAGSGWEVARRAPQPTYDL